MTQTIDPTTAKEPELWSWLAEQPCPHCSGRGNDYSDDPGFGCQGTGRAFQWASQPCERCHGGKGIDWCPFCNGSSRVPKAVGLADIILVIPYGVWSFVAGEGDWFCKLTIYSPGGDVEAEPQVFKGTDPDLTLAALRTVVKAKME